MNGFELDRLDREVDALLADVKGLLDEDGVPEAELPFIKQKFYKGTSKARGSGIGLAVVEEIVTRHGGHFEIGNAEGGGCIAQIYLPLRQSMQQ